MFDDEEKNEEEGFGKEPIEDDDLGYDMDDDMTDNAFPDDDAENY